MIFSFNELNKHFKKDLPAPEKLVESLTDHAFEVDEVIPEKGDFKLDIKVLPDRAGDAKNVLGMAREISSVTEAELKDEFVSYPDEKSARATIDFSVENINNLIGHDFSEAEIIAFLKRVRVVVLSEKDKLTALMPTERVDLNIKEDLADEIARLYGYANLKSKPLFESKELPVNEIFTLRDSLRSYFANKNFTEIYGYTFVPEGEVEIAKPLASDKAFLRTDLSLGMEKYLKQNLNHTVFLDDGVFLFEIGEVFPDIKTEQSRLCFGVAFANKKSDQSQKLVEEIVDDILDKFSVSKKDFVIKSGDHFFIAEINLDKIKKTGDISSDISPYLKKDDLYKPFSVYPRIVRDIAVFVPEDVLATEVSEKIQKEAGELLVYGPILFDEFKKQGKVSYAFRLIFQSYDKTLSDTEVNEVMDKVEKALESEEDFEIRR